MSARKQNRKAARKGRASPRQTLADMARSIEHLHAGAEISTKLIQALDGLLLDAAFAREAKRADAALIVWAAFSRLKIETGAVLLHAGHLQVAMKGGQQ